MMYVKIPQQVHIVNGGCSESPLGSAGVAYLVTVSKWQAMFLLNISFLASKIVAANTSALQRLHEFQSQIQKSSRLVQV